MHLTNKHKLPDIFCEAVGLFEGDYDRGESDHTATELIRPVRISVLTKKHWDQIEEDVSDRVWAFAGQVKHLVFERLAKKNPERYIAEHRMYAQVNGAKVSGRLDLFDRETSILWDWKESSVWKFMVGDTADWEAQANINAYCLRFRKRVDAFSTLGGTITDKSKLLPAYEVSALKNLVILKDWKVREAERRPDYPQCAVHIVDLPMWPDKQCENYITKRMLAYGDALEAEHRDKPLPLCTPEERWQDPEKFAVMKRGRKSAIKLWDTENQAHLHVTTDSQHGLYVEHRPSEPRRCLRYCPVAKFCDFGRRVLGLPELGYDGGDEHGVRAVEVSGGGISYES